MGIVMLFLGIGVFVTMSQTGGVYAEYAESAETLEIVEEDVIVIDDELIGASLSDADLASDSEASDATSSDEMDIEYINDNTIILPEPVRKGYIFIGWCSSPDGEEDATWYYAGDEYVISGEETLYAIWEKDPNADETEDGATPSEASVSEASASEANAGEADTGEAGEASASEAAGSAETPEEVPTEVPAGDNQPEIPAETEVLIDTETQGVIEPQTITTDAPVPAESSEGATEAPETGGGQSNPEPAEKSEPHEAVEPPAAGEIS